MVVDNTSHTSVYTKKAETFFFFFNDSELYLHLRVSHLSRSSPRFVYQSQAAQKTSQFSWVSQSALNTDVFATTATLPYCEYKLGLGN